MEPLHDQHAPLPQFPGELKAVIPKDMAITPEVNRVLRTESVQNQLLAWADRYRNVIIGNTFLNNVITIVENNRLTKQDNKNSTSIQACVVKVSQIWMVNSAQTSLNEWLKSPNPTNKSSLANAICNQNSLINCIPILRAYSEAGLLSSDQLIQLLSLQNDEGHTPLFYNDNYQFIMPLLMNLPFESQIKLIKAAVKKNGLALQLLPNELKKNTMIVCTIVYDALQQNGLSLEFASDKFKDNLESVKTAVRQNSGALKFASDRIKFEAVVYKNGLALESASEEFKRDPEIVQSAVSQNGLALQFASKEMKNNSEIVEAAVKQNGLALQFVSKEMKNYSEIVKAAVKQNGLALQFAPEEFKNNLKIVNIALLQNRGALEFASDRVKFIATVRQSGLALESASEEFKSDPEVVQAAVWRNGLALQFASDNLKKRSLIVSTALRQNVLAFEFAHDQLKNDPTFVDAAVKQNGLALQFASDEIKRDPEIVEAAINQNGLALQFASNDLKKDLQTVEAAVQKNGLALEYASDELKENITIVKSAIQQNLKAKSFVAKSILPSVKNWMIGIAKRRILQELKNTKNKEKVRKVAKQPSQIRRQNATKVAQYLNQRSETVKLNSNIREPIENYPRKAKDLLPMEKHSKLVSYERFVSTLRGAFSGTMEAILQSPPDEQSYVILADQKGKSTNWVASHVLDLMEIKRPEAIVTKEELADYLRKNPGIKHIVMIDDGAFSGAQVCEYIEKIGKQIDTKNLHICIPFMTKFAKEKIGTAPVSAKIVFPENQLMLSYQDMAKLGFYIQKRISRPDIKEFVSAPLLMVSNKLPPEQSQKLKLLDQRVKEFKSVIYKLEDTTIRDKFKKFKLDFENLCSELSLIKTLNGENDFLEEISYLREYAALFKEEDTMRLGVIDEDETYYSDRKTGTWMAHKSADDVSTNVFSMSIVANNQLAIEPYKEGPKGDKSIEELRKNQLSRLNAEEKEGFIFVNTNRGAFLLGDNYVKDSDKSTDIFLIIGNEKIPFGGSNGLYQWKLEDNTTFGIRNQKDGSSKIYKYENQQLTPASSTIP